MSVTSRRARIDYKKSLLTDLYRYHQTAIVSKKCAQKLSISLADLKVLLQVIDFLLLTTVRPIVVAAERERSPQPYFISGAGHNCIGLEATDVKGRVQK